MNKSDIDWVAEVNKIEDYTRYLWIRHDTYLMSHPDINHENMEIIRIFIKWCIDENQRDLSTPRGPDGRSYNERAAVQLLNNS